MGSLRLTGRVFVVFGVANRKSVAYHVGRALEQEGATVLYSVHTPKRAELVAKLLPEQRILACDLTDEQQLNQLVKTVGQEHPRIHGLCHCVAFANYADYSGVFHQVDKADFLQAVEVSCYSLIATARAFEPLFDDQASVVTISISSTTMAAESYGYMAPAKAALNSTVVFLAKSFSRRGQVRFNAVGAGLLKTRASAGIPNYLENYLFAEQATFRKQALTTEEVANVAAFLMSPRSTGINGQVLTVDAGMGLNYFDEQIVKHTVAGLWPAQNRDER